ncbi:MAG: hypothetical protein R3E01_32690 [Pirellulaceae bacterium]|nr:hypothetical protein [Planctomycetales bacterium]
MRYPGRFLATVVLISAASLGALYQYLGGFAPAPPVLVPGLREPQDMGRGRPHETRRPTILEPSEEDGSAEAARSPFRSDESDTDDAFESSIVPSPGPEPADHDAPDLSPDLGLVPL